MKKASSSKSNEAPRVHPRTKEFAVFGKKSKVDDVTRPKTLK